MSDTEKTEKKTEASPILVATRSGVIGVGGRRHVIKQGQTRVRATHECVAGHENWFQPADEGLTFDDESQTASVGGGRGRQRAAA